MADGAHVEMVSFTLNGEEVTVPEGLTICPLADAAVMPMRSFIDKFRPEFEALIQETAPAEPTSRAYLASAPVV